MSLFRERLIASFCCILLTSGASLAMSTADYTDQWWVPSESGWGAAMLQQNDTLFVNLMVYGSDARPTWFVAAARLQPNVATGPVFSGALYSSTGPYYGTTFDPRTVGLREVGTLTFEARSATDAALSYTVDGTKVVKPHITRQSWSYNNLTGTYLGAWSGDRLNCISDPIGQVTHFEDPISVIVVHNAGDNSVTITLQYADGVSESFNGIYSQSGRVGRITGDFVGLGSMVVTEIQATSAGFSARFEGDLLTAHWHNWCDMKNGRIGGVLR